MQNFKYFREFFATAISLTVSGATIGSIAALAASEARQAIETQTYPMLAVALLAVAGAYFSARPTAQWVRSTFLYLTRD